MSRFGSSFGIPHRVAEIPLEPRPKLSEERGDQPLTKREAMDALICKQCERQFVPHYERQTVCATCALKNLGGLLDETAGNISEDEDRSVEPFPHVSDR